jgi:hypothetical protein
MPRYLLAAEADKIQDFIFRSSRLREVVGASQLLSRFCQDGITPLLERHGGHPLVNDGGGFRIRFEGDDDEEVKKQAKEFGADLAELYQLVLGGSLSVGEPASWNGSFPDANETAGKNLRRAKEHRSQTLTDPHMSYVAYCASCGVGLANRHGHLGKEPARERGRFLCPTCQDKDRERNHNRENLLDEWLRLVLNSGEDPEQFGWPDDADSVARYDPRGRNYVAYLVADGNGMGRIFGKCNETAIGKLSEGLSSVVKIALADAAKPLRNHLAIAKPHLAWDVPILPLILGGDDVFVLLPAPYTLDFAQRFCRAFESEMQQLLKEPKFQGLDVPPPTMAAAVVICKSNYPYALAHRRGDDLLKEAKRLCKQLAAECGQHRSAVSFEVILGNRLTGQMETEGEKDVRRSLKPYWVTPEKGALSKDAQRYSIALDSLLKERLALKDVPNKRIHELRTAFANLPDDIQPTELANWEKSLQRLFDRSGHKKKLCAAMDGLGQSTAGESNSHHWREVKRKDANHLAHGLPDLFEAWDFAQDLYTKLSDYEAQEEGEE